MRQALDYAYQVLTAPKTHDKEPLLSRVVRYVVQVLSVLLCTLFKTGLTPLCMLGRQTATRFGRRWNKIGERKGPSGGASANVTLRQRMNDPIPVRHGDQQSLDDV